MREEDITIITPIRDEDPKYFRNFIFAALKNSNCPVVIVNDQSQQYLVDRYLKEIKKYDRHRRVTFYNSGERHYMAGGIWKAGEVAQTEYVMRIDSDDVLIKMPPLDQINQNFDPSINFYVPDNYRIDPADFITWPTWMHAKIIKRDFFLEMYKHYPIYNPYQDEMAEDVFFAMIALMSPNLKYQRLDYNDRKCYLLIRHTHNSMCDKMMKNVPSIKQQRLNTIQLLLDNDLMTQELHQKLTALIKQKLK